MGSGFVLQLDDWIPYQVFLTGMYAVEASATRFFHTLLRPGMVVLDVGANIGYYTLQAAVRVGPGGQVHAFEPVAASHARLVQNVRLNELTNVAAVRAAAGSRRGSGVIHLQTDATRGMRGSRLGRSDATGLTEAVDVIPLDDYVNESGIPAVDVVKIDVEGHELEVLQGMEGILARGSPHVMLEVVEEPSPHSSGTSRRGATTGSGSREAASLRSGRTR